MNGSVSRSSSFIFHPSSFLLYLSLSLFAASLHAEEPKNLLINAGFEDQSAAPWEKRTPDSPERSLSIADQAAHGGRRVCRIVNDKPVVSRWRQGADHKIVVPMGAVVRLTGWIRTDLGAEGAAFLRLYGIGDGDKIVAQPGSMPVSGKSDWKRVSFSATVPPGTTYLMLYLELENAVGAADYDDILLTVAVPPSPRKALNDLALFTDAPADDPVAQSLQTLYPDRLVRIAPSEKPDWERYHGAVVFGRTPDAQLDTKVIEEFAARGTPVVLDLAVYARLRGLQVRETSGTDTPTLKITREHRAVKGFRPGDSIPWYAGDKKRMTQRVLEGAGPAQVLGESSRGGVLLVAEQVGKGTLLATDLTGLPEPAYNLPGALNKYLFLGNVLGQTARYGRYYPSRLKYDEFVKAMQSLAAQHPDSMRFTEEGPANGAYRLCSLNLGDPKKPAFFLYGATHGSEWEPAYGLLALAELLASKPAAKRGRAEGGPADILFDFKRYSLKIVPILNPSGYDLFTRKSAAHVDLNRNGGEWWDSYKGKASNKNGVWGPDNSDWKGPAPFSEPETQTFRAICEKTKIHAVLDFHGNAGGRGNNRLIVLPRTGREGNDERADNAVRDFNLVMRDRYVLKQAQCDRVEQYDIEATHWDGPRPTLIETACRGRYGFICEVPAGYSGTYGIVFQTDVVIETCLAFFRAYQ